MVQENLASLLLNARQITAGEVVARTNGHGPESDVGKVALYLRVSSDEQRERESIKTQREFFEQYRELYRLEVTETYADDGVSGTAPLHERPEVDGS